MKRLRERVQQSLMARLTAFVLGGMLLVWIALTIGLYVQMEHEIGELQSRELQESGQLLLSHLGEEARLPAHVAAPMNGDVNMAFSLYDLQGRLLASSHSPALPLFKQADTNEHTLRINGQLWRVRWFSNQQRQLIVAIPAALRRQLALEIASDQLLPAGIMLVCWLLVTLWGLRLGLRPLNAFSAELQSRTPDNLSPINARLPTELGPVVERLNALFGHISQTLVRERRFTGDAAHELRTPLAGLQLQLELALHAKQAESRERALLNVQTSANRMTHLVDQLLKLARLDHAEQLDLTPVDLPRLCEEILNQCGLVGTVTVNQAVAWQADSASLSLLLRNLLSNIVRYAGPAPRADIVIDGGQISIRDHGPGVSTDWLNRLGERFARPDVAQRDGVGLGLSIAQRIAELHGSSLHFSLADGGGLCVSFTLPLAAVTPEVPNEYAP